MSLNSEFRKPVVSILNNEISITKEIMLHLLKEGERKPRCSNIPKTMYVNQQDAQNSCD